MLLYSGGCADGQGRQEGRKRNTKAGTDADMLDEQREEAATYETERYLGRVNCKDILVEEVIELY